MEKERLLFFVNNYNSLSPEETEELLSLRSGFAYSQIIQELIARGCQDNQLSEKESALHLAAVYSTDRAVLKQIMTSPRIERPQEIIAEPAVTVTSDLKERKEIKEVPVAESSFSMDRLRDQLIEDLKKLKTLKGNFELSVKEYDKVAEKALKKKNKSEETGLPADSLLEEIKSTKKKVKPDSPKQKEQKEIIDQFIKSKPAIGKVKAAVPETDLTSENESYSENVISETLVELLIRQGKKDKAVEVLKKLIWKFPQKKTYFAARIEDLKK